jgi:hypothetical protein
MKTLTDLHELHFHMTPCQHSPIQRQNNATFDFLRRGSLESSIQEPSNLGARIESLLELGHFTPAECKVALSISFYDLDRAANYLIGRRPTAFVPGVPSQPTLPGELTVSMDEIAEGLKLTEAPRVPFLKSMGKIEALSSEPWEMSRRIC